MTRCACCGNDPDEKTKDHEGEEDDWRIDKKLLMKVKAV
jgi:hypothetical protein